MRPGTPNRKKNKSRPASVIIPGYNHQESEDETPEEAEGNVADLDMLSGNFCQIQVLVPA
jgi:hypothetical protein